MLYTAKGTAALLVPFGNVIATVTGSWHAVFVIAAMSNAAAALMALLVLKPLCRSHHTRQADITGGLETAPVV
jgi:OFA family oxalate/formate antiporter-like MFS transporter